MTRHDYGQTPSAQHANGRLKKFVTAGVAILAMLALIMTMMVRPVAYAESADRPSTGQLAASGTVSPATVLVYLNGSDLESEGGEASADIAEMLASSVGKNVNVVIETLGTREWQNYGIASDHSQRYLVKNGELVLVDDSLGQLDTTSADTLSDFISWGTKNYPAERYMLVMWDHGAGPVYGFGYDEFQGDYAALTLDEIRDALKANSNVHFDFIGMDCCIMSSLETCVVLEPYCDYTILSEDFEPGIGWSYRGWLDMLEKNPGVSTKDLGSTITDDMVKSAAANPENGEATLALIDESAVPALYSAWINFAYENKEALLSTNYSQEVEQHGHFGSGDGALRPGLSGHGGSGFGTRLDSEYGRGYDSPFGIRDDYGYGSGSEYGYGNSYGSGSGSCPGCDDHGYGYDSDNSGSCPECGYYGYGYDPESGSGSCEGCGSQYGFGFDDRYGYGYPDDNSHGNWGNFYDSWDYDASYITMSDYFVTDINEVAASVDSGKSAELESALENAIVHYSATSGEEGMSGLSVTLPYGDAEFYDQLVDVFTACDIDSDYIEWLGAFVAA